MESTALVDAFTRSSNKIYWLQIIAASKYVFRVIALHRKYVFPFAGISNSDRTPIYYFIFMVQSIVESSGRWDFGTAGHRPRSNSSIRHSTASPHTSALSKSNDKNRVDGDWCKRHSHSRYFNFNDFPFYCQTLCHYVGLKMLSHDWIPIVIAIAVIVVVAIAIALDKLEKKPKYCH